MTPGDTHSTNLLVLKFSMIFKLGLNMALVRKYFENLILRVGDLKKKEKKGIFICDFHFLFLQSVPASKHVLLLLELLWKS